jgi:gamma-glutamylcyclotransferase (GGCT)/AIG2-like uncharacterized protein YtfP
MSEHLFTYGTLRPGLAPAALAPVMERLRLVGEGWTPGILYDFGSYPGAVFDESSSSRVFGTVYALPDDASGDRETLQRLDEYEEYDPTFPDRSQYLRVLCSVNLATGETLHCWVYHYNRNPGRAEIIASGRWG